jgi:sulfhydrogenase subunit alpha
VALTRPDEYAVVDGRIATSEGVEVDVAGFPDLFDEHHVAHSTALHALTKDGRAYMCGPLARYALNRNRLAPVALEEADRAGLGPVVRNPFRSIVVRAVETLHALDEAVRLVESYREPTFAAVEVPPRAATGHGATEAPRGLLYHRYAIDDDGTILDARIVPPTSQNQARVEQDLRAFVEPRLHLPKTELTLQCEQAIRNYDPCISCATHFLDMRVVEV